MNNDESFIFPIFLAVFVSFIIMCCLFGVLNEKIENLEKFHINDICSQCGKHVY